MTNQSFGVVNRVRDNSRVYPGGCIRNITSVNEGLEVNFENGNTIEFHTIWLRDQCRCSNCYHSNTFQRAKHILELPDVVIVNLAYTKNDVTIKWSDNHDTIYTAKFLSQFEYKTWKENKKLKHLIWRGGRVNEKVSRVHVDTFLNSVDGAKRVFQSLLDYGVAFIEGVEPSTEATEVVCKALGGIQYTLFGGMWEFTTIADHADTAYTNLPLASHNDNTYFTEAAGAASHGYLKLLRKSIYADWNRSVTRKKRVQLLPILPLFGKTRSRPSRKEQHLKRKLKLHINSGFSLQILHCLEHSNGTGGETTLVDGFYGALCLKEEHPEDYEFLTTYDVEAEYVEENHHHTYSAPVIIVDKKTQDLRQIRFNVYDRSAMPFERQEDCKLYYRSLRNLSRYYEDQNNQWQFKLKPGTVLVMDNFRVLHGRTGFSGRRVLSGCYVSRSDWLNRARTLQLIH